MIIHKKLVINSGGNEHTLYFGEANTSTEIDEVYRLRYQVYSEKKYIDLSSYSEAREIDEYDTKEISRYFIAQIEKNDVRKIIGCIRMIVCDPLPIESEFEFEEPTEVLSIPRNKRFEIGRFIIIPPDKKKGVYLPRGVVRLFLLDIVAEFASKNGFTAGYAFVKLSLNRKLLRSRVPVNYIKKYKFKYPTSSVLYNYFTDVGEPVIPLFFITNDIIKYARTKIGTRLMFKKNDDGTYVFCNNIFTYMLKSLKII